LYNIIQNTGFFICREVLCSVLIREELEKLEAQILSPYAAKSADSRGSCERKKNVI